MKKKFMNRKTKIIISLLVIGIIGCYSATAVILANSDYRISDYFDSSSWHFEWSFDFDDWDSTFSNKHNSSGSLELDYSNTMKNINIQTSSADTTVIFDTTEKIKLEISGKFSSDHDYNDAIYEFKMNNDTLSLRTQNKSSIARNVKLTLHVPKDYEHDLDISSSSGSIKVENTNLNNLALQTSSGDIELNNNNNVCDKFTATSSSGSIKISNLTSKSTKCSSSSGDIELNGELGKFDITSTSGEISAKCLNSIGDNSSLKSTSGDIKLDIKDIDDYSINYTTSSGDLDCDSDYHKDSKREYTIGHGNNSIEIKTTSGDLEINN